MDEIAMMRCIEVITEAFNTLNKKVERLEKELSDVKSSERKAKKGKMRIPTVSNGFHNMSLIYPSENERK